MNGDCIDELYRGQYEYKSGITRHMGQHSEYGRCLEACQLDPGMFWEAEVDPGSTPSDFISCCVRLVSASIRSRARRTLDCR